MAGLRGTWASAPGYCLAPLYSPPPPHTLGFPQDELACCGGRRAAVGGRIALPAHHGAITDGV